MILTRDIASRFAEIALGHVGREYPHKLDQVLEGAEDLLPPSVLHPIFFGSFDWHSCVHGYWLLLRLRRLFPKLPVARRIARLADDMLTPEKVAGERAYLDRAYTGGFERPYGWAWLLALHNEALLHGDKPWHDDLTPLADVFSERFGEYLTKLTYPIRTGAHFNTAFAMTLALDWAGMNGDEALEETIRGRALDYFGGDRDCPGWEPDGDSFLSSALVEALLMSRILSRSEFPDWLALFLPRLGVREPASLFAPAFVSDRSDGKIAHLDGFNFSRAWCWRGLTHALPTHLAPLAMQTADAHLDAAFPHVAGDYMGEHWLATFALLALE